MDHPAYTRGRAGRDQRGGQLHMRAFKLRLGAVQNRDQIDHRVVSGHQGGQLASVVHIGLQHVDQRQHLQVLCVATATRGHGDAALQLCQLFTHMAADKPGAAQDENFFHGGAHGVAW